MRNPYGELRGPSAAVCGAAVRRMTIMGVLDGEHHDETLRHMRDGTMDCPSGEQGIGRGERSQTSGTQLNVPEYSLRCELKGAAQWLNRAG